MYESGLKEEKVEITFMRRIHSCCFNCHMTNTAIFSSLSFSPSFSLTNPPKKDVLKLGLLLIDPLDGHPFRIFVGLRFRRRGCVLVRGHADIIITLKEGEKETA